VDDDVRVITLDMLLVLGVLEDGSDGQQIAALAATRDQLLVGRHTHKSCKKILLN